MELISHIYANATFSRELQNNSSLENLASKQNFRIFKQQTKRKTWS